MQGRFKGDGGPFEIVCGSFRPGVTGVKSSGTVTITATNVFTFTAASAGTAGDALTVQMLDDGGTLDLGGVTANIDTIVEVATPGTDILITIINAAGAGTGALYEGADYAIFVLEDAVTTVTNFETLVGGSTLLAVHTAGTGANVFASATDEVDQETVPGLQHSATGSAGGIVIHFNDSTTTVAQVVADVAAISGAVITLAASGTTSNTLVAADVIAAPGTAISGLTGPVAGVDAVSASESVASDQVTVAKSSTPAGTYTVTLPGYAKKGEVVAIGAELMIATAEDRIPQATSFSAGVLTITVLSTAAETDVTDGANNSVHWFVVFKK